MLSEYVNQLAKSLFLVVSTYSTNELILNGGSENNTENGTLTKVGG